MITVDLYNTRVPRLAGCVVSILLAIFPWTLTIPLWLKLTGSTMALLSLMPRTMDYGRWVRTLYLGTSGTLSVAVSIPGENLHDSHLYRVHSLRVLRLLRYYVEMVMDLGEGKTARLMILPGMCTADGMRRLRKFLLYRRSNSS